MELAGRHIPNRLREHRMIHGYRQKEVAQLLGHRSANQLCKWENGEAMPGLVNILRLSIIYSALPTDFYFDILKEQQEYIATRGRHFLSTLGDNISHCPYIVRRYRYLY